ncbi:MAG: nucleotidyltransferase family protein [Acidobacteriota bacterium]
MTSPRLSPLGELTRRALNDETLEPLSTSEEEAWLEFLTERRLVPELSALPARKALSMEAQTRLAIERGRVEVLGRRRRAAVERVGAALHAEGVVAQLYKGEAVVRLTHGELGRRPMSDLDLVVLPEQVAPAEAALTTAGFRRTGHDTALHTVWRLETGGVDGGEGLCLELHLDLFPPPHPFDLQVGRFFERGVEAGVPGLQLPGLVDAFLLQSFHLILFEQDGAKTWPTLRDLALLSRRLVDERGEEGVAELCDEADRRGLGALARSTWTLAGVAGAPAWPKAVAPRAAPWRRALALRLSNGELVRGLAEDGTPRPRRLTRRFSAALWHERSLTSARALVRGVLGTSSERSLGGTASRVGRHALALLRARR